MKPCSFILGSGNSLLNLTDKEKSLLNRHPYTLAMNKYLLFYEKIGVIPSDYFLADIQFPAQMVANRSLKIAASVKPDMGIYFHSYYKALYGRTELSGIIIAKLLNLIRIIKNRLKIRWKVWKDHRYWISLRPPKAKIKFFRCDFSSRMTNWADNLEHPLYFYRGSLTTAINLANLVYPNTDICLLGVDLNHNKSFYDDEISKLPEFIRNSDPRHVERMKMSRDCGKHATMLTYKGVPGIQAVILDIVKELNRRGYQLFCGNPNSYLVEQGICGYRTVASCFENSRAI